MGNLLRLLQRDDCCSQQKYDLYLDFENAVPTDEERYTFDKVQEVIDCSNDILRELKSYQGASKEISEAISCPLDEEAQERAWQIVIPHVTKLKQFYDFSSKLESVVPDLLYELCKGPMSPFQHLETQQALVKQLAEILQFTLEFDEIKMTMPAIQNDFSYYRRTISKQQMLSNSTLDAETNVNGLTANSMSLFYAHSTPMLKLLSDTTSNFVNQHKGIPVENTTETLGTMAKVCQKMMDSNELMSRFQRPETTSLFVIRVMVGLIILYDHVHPLGAFVKSSHVDVKGCIKVLKEKPTSNSENLLNALRFTTKHLNNENTPRAIKQLLAV